MKTQVAIIGGGPAGLLLAHLLHAAGIACVVIERRDRAYVEGRVRAGVLEQTTVDIMRQLGLAERLGREGLPHNGFSISFDDELLPRRSRRPHGRQMRHRLWPAGSHEGPLRRSRSARPVDRLQRRQRHPARHRNDFARRDIAPGTENAERIACDFIAGCDGFHGVSRTAIPADVLREYEKVYPFGWLGILADVPPADHELIYASHDRGFALASMRSKTRSRYYIQVGLEEGLDAGPTTASGTSSLPRLGARGGADITRGPSFEKSIAPLRSYVAEPMRHGRLFLAGDAAHIVPPTGAKGLNLASSDVLYPLRSAHRASIAQARPPVSTVTRNAPCPACGKPSVSRGGSPTSRTASRHTTPLERRLQVAEIDYIRGSRAAQTTLAENYVGLPLDSG